MESQTAAVELSHLIWSRDVWPRLSLDEERVALFMDLYKAGGAEALPPIEVVPISDGKKVVADGIRRATAAHRLGWKTLPAMLHAYPEDAEPAAFAYDLALERASTSAQPLTRAERQRAVLRQVAEHPERSDREIGRLCGVAHTTVGRLRKGRKVTSAEEPGEDRMVLTTAHELATRLFRGMEKVWDSRGLGILDSFLGDRTAERLATVLRDAYADDGLARAQLYGTWIDGAIAHLKERSA